jgi:hypothetical protein
MTTNTNLFESDIIHQVRNFVEETLLLHAPDCWSDEELFQIEETVLDRTSLALRSFAFAKTPSLDPTRLFIEAAVETTKHLIGEKKSRGKWLFPEDIELTTLQITLPGEVIEELDAAVITYGLEDREMFSALAIEYVLQTLLDPKAS